MSNGATPENCRPSPSSLARRARHDPVRRRPGCSRSQRARRAQRTPPSLDRGHRTSAANRTHNSDGARRAGGTSTRRYACGLKTSGYRQVFASFAGAGWTNPNDRPQPPSRHRMTSTLSCGAYSPTARTARPRRAVCGRVRHVPCPSSHAMAMSLRPTVGSFPIQTPRWVGASSGTDPDAAAMVCSLPAAARARSV